MVKAFTYIRVITANHFSIGYLVTETVCWFIGVHRHVQDIRSMSDGQRGQNWYRSHFFWGTRIVMPNLNTFAVSQFPKITKNHSPSQVQQQVLFSWILDQVQLLNSNSIDVTKKTGIEIRGVDVNMMVFMCKLCLS